MNFDWNSIKPSWSSIAITVVASIMICAMICTVCIGCKERKPEGRAVTNDYCYVIAKIDGHDYIIGGLIGKYGAGLTHSESCSCKKGIK